jgi:hypothetical protein
MRRDELDEQGGSVVLAVVVGGVLRGRARARAVWVVPAKGFGSGELHCETEGGTRREMELGCGRERWESEQLYRERREEGESPRRNDRY